MSTLTQRFIASALVSTAAVLTGCATTGMQNTHLENQETTSDYISLDGVTAPFMVYCPEAKETMNIIARKEIELRELVPPTIVKKIMSQVAEDCVIRAAKKDPGLLLWLESTNPPPPRKKPEFYKL